MKVVTIVHLTFMYCTAVRPDDLTRLMSKSKSVRTFLNCRFTTDTQEFAVQNAETGFDLRDVTQDLGEVSITVSKDI